jgi:hypothetical protein
VDLQARKDRSHLRGERPHLGGLPLLKEEHRQVERRERRVVGHLAVGKVASHLAEHGDRLDPPAEPGRDATF